jgi:SPX domain protein involved in polyphosphate accumulation
MAHFTDQSRYEYKYKINAVIMSQIREFIQPFTKYDDHLEKCGHRQYTVRSIYFDTPEFDFYYEKLDGVKIRKKLRVRTYNDIDDYAFLEIKRKYLNCVAKERSRLSILTIERLINTHENCVYEFPQNDHSARIVSGRFLYNLLKKGLVPILLVVYEREAYVDKMIDHNRLTIDINLRALSKPDLRDMMNTDNFKYITGNDVILELKFNNFMPKWMKDLASEFKLKRQSISKYCLGIHACYDCLADGEIL